MLSGPDSATTQQNAAAHTHTHTQTHTHTHTHTHRIMTSSLVRLLILCIDSEATNGSTPTLSPPSFLPSPASQCPTKDHQSEACVCVCEVCVCAGSSPVSCVRRVCVCVCVCVCVFW